MHPKSFWTPNIDGPKTLCTQNLYGCKIFWDPEFFELNSFEPNFFLSFLNLGVDKVLGPNICLSRIFLTHKFFLMQNFVGLKFFWSQNILKIKKSFWIPKFLLNQKFILCLTNGSFLLLVSFTSPCKTQA